MKSLNKATKIGLAALMLCVSGLTAPALTESAVAQRANPDRQGLPGRRVGGGVRKATAEACLTDQQSQIAIAPETNLLLTAKAKPAVLFYLPKSNTPRTVEFVLTNDKHEELHVTTTQTDSNSGIVRVDLADSAVSLIAEQKYRWYFSVVCDASDRSNDLVAEGWLKKTNLTAAASTAEPTLAATEQLQTAGLWSDALANLDTLRRQQPNNAAVESQWTNFLAALDLSAIAAEAPADHLFETVALEAGY